MRPSAPIVDRRGVRLTDRAAASVSVLDAHRCTPQLDAAGAAGWACAPTRPPTAIAVAPTRATNKMMTRFRSDMTLTLGSTPAKYKLASVLDGRTLAAPPANSDKSLLGGTPSARFGCTVAERRG